MTKAPDAPKRLKKIIDIPGDIVKDLKKMAVDADMDLKTYIQTVLIALVRNDRKNNN